MSKGTGFVEIEIEDTNYINQLRLLPIAILQLQWLDASLHNPLPKFWHQCVFKARPLVSNMFLNVFWTNVFSKVHWNQGLEVKSD